MRIQDEQDGEIGNKLYRGGSMNDIEFALFHLENARKGRLCSIEVGHMLPSQLKEAEEHVKLLDSAIEKIKTLNSPVSLKLDGEAIANVCISKEI